MPDSHINQPADGSDPTKQDQPEPSSHGLLKFAALIVGLFVLAYVMMKALSAIWPA
jgi:hypothetical protein